MWRRARGLILASALGCAPGLSACDDEDTTTGIDEATGDGMAADGEDGAPGDGVSADGEPADGEPADGTPADGTPADGTPDTPDASVDGSVPVEPDGGVIEGPDAAVPDAGDGPVPDAGSTPDAGLGIDAGIELDAGPGIDAGPELDAGPALDAGPDPVCELPAEDAPLGDNRALNALLLAPTGCNSPVAEAPAKLFDGDDATKFLCRQPRPTIGVLFPGLARYAVKSYTLTSGNDAPARDPKHWRLEGTSDGVTWDVVDERIDEAFAERGETRRFDIANCTPYARYRLVVVQNNGEGLFQLAELRLYGERAPDAPSLTSGATITSTCPNLSNPAEDASAAFDGNVLSKWFCGQNQTPIVEVEFADGATHQVTSYAVASGNDLPDRDPASWVIEASNDGVVWEQLAPGQDAQVFVARSQLRTFTLDNARFYGRYRLRVLANGGSADFQVAELALFGE